MQELEQPEISIQRKFRNNLKVAIQIKYRNNLKGLNERKEEEAMASMKSAVILCGASTLGKQNGLPTSISASPRYPTVSLVMSTKNGSSRGLSLDERSPGSLPRIVSRITVQSVALLQNGPSLSW